MTQVDWKARTLHIFSCVILIAVLTPEWWAFFKSETFVFVNGWDEETYLSWQGVIGVKNLPGYFVSYLNFALHNLGFSGAHQNLIFDTIFFPLTVLLVFLSFRQVNFGQGRQLAYAVIVCLSSVFFNYANPIVSFILGPYNGRAFLMAGHEYYPSILRTPNPQISYFLIAFSIYIYLRFRRIWILVLPLPLLYYYVAVPYILTLGFIFSSMWFIRRGGVIRVINIVILGVAIFIIFSLFLMLFFYLGGLYELNNHLRQNQLFFFETRTPQLPLLLLILGIFCTLLFKLKLMRIDRAMLSLLGWLGFGALASVNVHLVTGFMLAQKNYYDYGLSVILGLGLVVIFEMLKSENARYCLLLFCLAIGMHISFQSQWGNSNQALIMSAKVTPVLVQARKDPLHSIIPDLATSSHVAYTTPKLLAPPFSYLYYFSFIAKQCVYYEHLLGNAIYYAHENLSNNPNKLKLLNSTVANIEKGRSEALSVPFVNRGYCESELYNKTNFFVIFSP